jgi:hypothetical protein
MSEWIDKPTQDGVYWMAVRDKGRKGYDRNSLPVEIYSRDSDCKIRVWDNRRWRTIPEIGVYKNRVKFLGPLPVPAPPLK